MTKRINRTHLQSLMLKHEKLEIMITAKGKMTFWRRGKIVYFTLFNTCRVLDLDYL